MIPWINGVESESSGRFLFLSGPLWARPAQRHGVSHLQKISVVEEHKSFCLCLFFDEERSWWCVHDGLLLVGCYSWSFSNALRRMKSQALELKKKLFFYLDLFVGRVKLSEWVLHIWQKREEMRDTEAECIWCSNRRYNTKIYSLVLWYHDNKCRKCSQSFI